MLRGKRITGGHLGLFDTPPDRREIRLGMAAIGLLILVALLALPALNVNLPPVSATIPMVNAILFVGELIIATLLYAQARVFRARSLTILASGFVFMALLLIPYVLTFPGVFASNGLLGAGASTAAWIIIVRKFAFPLVVLFYLVMEARRSVGTSPTGAFSARRKAGVAAAGVAAALVTIFATIGHDYLPTMFVDRFYGLYYNLLWINFAHAAVTLAAIVVLLRKRKSVLEMWLLVALAGWLIQSLLNLGIEARYTVGWYSLYLIMLFSHLAVLLALITDSNRLYAQLAVETAARERELETRLMSMEAVAAAVAHEVGQPLTAVSLNASASLNWLNRKRPHVENAIQSLSVVVDSARRSFEVLKGIRSVFGGAPSPAAEFDLNELVRETADLCNRDLVTAQVKMQLSLDEKLRPIFGNRIQIQQVILNILRNAVDSLSSSPHDDRHLVISTSAADDSNVLLEISDSGAGIDAETLPHLFKPFHTTKATGTGIGLSLSRSIVEEHGGVIWASAGSPRGATFHVQLPSRRRNP